VQSRANFPLIWFQGPIDAGNVTIRSFAREEKTVSVASIRVDKDAVVRNLTVRDCRMNNRLGAPMPFLETLGKVSQLTCDNVEFSGEWSHRNVE